MSTVKTATSVLTAAVLVTSIGLAFAQSEETPAAPPIEQTTVTPLTAEQTTPAADPTAMPLQSNAAVQQPAEDPSRTTPPPAEPAQTPAQQPATQSTAPMTPAPAYREPAPRADRN